MLTSQFTDLRVWSVKYFFFGFVFALSLSKQFFSHVGTEPPLPWYNQYFWAVNVSCSRAQHGHLSVDRTPTSRSGVRRSTTRPPRLPRKVLRHSLFCRKDRKSVQRTYMFAKFYIFVTLGLLIVPVHAWVWHRNLLNTDTLTSSGQVI